MGLEQLVALGLSPGVVYRRARTGRLHRIHRGVYALTPRELVSWRGRYLAAVLACGPRAVLSHRSAADLHGLLATSRARIDATVAGRRLRRHPGVDVHRSITLCPADTTTVDGIPCTGIARTLLDLAAVVRRDQRERALNQADVLRALDLRALEDQLARNPNTRAAARLRDALALYRPGDAPTESVLEQRLVGVLRAAGLPAPERQVRFTSPDGPFLADFVWPAQRAVVETDGRRAHATAAAFETDRRRDQWLVRAGWRVVRVTWRQLDADPGSVVELLSELLAAG